MVRVCIQTGESQSTEQREFGRSGPSWGETPGFFGALSYQEGFASPELTLLSVVS
jgi:hypothetical protein